MLHPKFIKNKPVLAICLLAFFTLSGCLIQRIQKYKTPRDKLFLTSGEVETGKILAIDSHDIRLRKPDFAERVYPKRMVDSIAGLSFRTHFISIGAVGGEVNYWSRLLLEKGSASGAGYEIRWGRLVGGRRCRYYQFQKLNLDPFDLSKWSFGWNYYFLKPYFGPKNWYAGARFDINKLEKNGWFYSNFAFTTGGEYFVREKIRLFGEANYLKNFSPAQPKPSWVFGLGIRFGFREHSVFYKNLNGQLK